ncbi:MAG: excinuclease ABC subunit UvrC [Candidatus Omnitrophota bacterium]|nr:excinuclease ABC subunit UvrC [Candidatus Omnitrophota bacterium]
MALKEKIKTFPDSCGVYLMKDTLGKIIYIGKALCLRKRVGSYFWHLNTRNAKTNLLIAHVNDIDFIKTRSEAEALILEAGLIKRNFPKYNVEMRDGKSYPFIKITKEEFPTIMIARPRKKDNAVYFGPYTSVRLLKEALRAIRGVFPYRTCKIRKKKKACLDYHLGLCPGVCIGKVKALDYQKTMQNIRMVLEGRQTELLDKLYKEMRIASDKTRFEEAAKIRNQIEALGALYFESKPKGYLQEANTLKEALKLTKLPWRIEAFDISNILGKEAVGSMVYFLRGRPDKNNYRRFKIKTVNNIDDYKMLSEIVCRRYSRLKQEGRKMPDLIVIDGGKGQLCAVKQELDKLGLNISVIAIAKENEEIFAPETRTPLKLSFDNPGLQLLQRVRNEAHRFALKYHRLLRKKATFKK